MEGKKIKVDDSIVRRLLKRFPEELFDRVKDVFDGITLDTQRAVLDHMKSSSDSSLKVRTGRLARSIRTSTTGNTVESLRSSVYSDLLYAGIHETGGEIKAKKAFRYLEGGPYLAIPSDINKTKAGVTRLSVRDAFSLPKQMYVIKLRNSVHAKFMLVDRDMGPLFWLVKSVTIKPHLQMESTAKGKIPTLLSRLDNLMLEGM